MKSDDVPNLRGIAAAIVEHLPGYGLAPLPDESEGRGATWARDNAYLTVDGTFSRGQSKGLHVGQSWPRGRIEVGCLWPSVNGTQFSPRESMSITISADRPPRAIAKDIQRRLLAWYETEWEEACQRRERHCGNEVSKQVFAAACQSIMRPAAHRNGMSVHCAGVSVEVHSHDRASLKVGFESFPLVEAVLRALEQQGHFVPRCCDDE